MKQCTLQLIRKMYDLYNRKYFGSKLPKDVGFYWASHCRHLTKPGQKFFKTNIYGLTVITQNADQSISTDIIFNDVFKKHLVFLGLTLLHEMLHVQLKGGTHGPKFKKARKRLMRLGAFDEWL